jgi:hypothetical protein
VLILITLITSVNFISPRGRKNSMHVTVTSKGVPEQGLFLVGPSDVSFAKHLSAALADESSKIPDTAKLLSVFVENSTSHTVVAYHLKWELIDADGRSTSHQRSYKEPLSLMENWNQDQHFEGESIAPGSSRLISLIPFITDTRGPGGSIGGGILERTEKRDVEVMKRALQERNTQELANKFSNSLDRVVKITVSLDGAFFDNGTFVGPDETQFFSKFEAQITARYDLHNRIQKMLLSNKPSQKILQYVSEIADAPREHLGSDSPPIKFNDFYRRLYAQEISRIWNSSGQESVSRFVGASISRQWASLKKL